MSTEAKNPCGALGQLTLRAGTVTIGCGLEKGHDEPRKITRWMGLESLPGTPHRFWAEWRDDPATGAVDEEPAWEYGVGWRWNETIFAFSTITRTAAEDYIERHPEDLDFGSHILVQREPEKPAGPWVPVKQEGVEPIAAHEGHRILESPTVSSLATGLIPRTCTTCDLELDPRKDRHG